MSATKGFAALCVQLLDDRGQIDIDAPVAGAYLRRKLAVRA